MTEPTKKPRRVIAARRSLALGCAASANAEEGTSHYAPETSATLAQAVENFVTCNDKVQEVLARDELTGADMEQIHEYTCTLEAARAKINEDLGALPVVLERVHQASEGDNVHELRAVAEVYLERVQVLDR